MRKLMMTLGVTVSVAGLLLFLWAQGHAYSLVWDSNHGELGRILASDSDMVPLSIQLAMYEAGAGRWSSVEFRAPLLALGAILLGFGFGSLATLDRHELPRLRRWARAMRGAKSPVPKAEIITCPKCGSALGKGVTRCWASGCTYEVGDWY